LNNSDSSEEKQDPQSKEEEVSELKEKLMSSLPDKVIVVKSNVVTVQSEDPTKKPKITKIYYVSECKKGSDLKDSESLFHFSLTFDSQEQAAYTP